MANRYWVPGGNGNYEDSSNWSTFSGGPSGASVPISSDDIFFDDNSSSGNYSVGGTSVGCRNLTITGTRNITFSLLGTFTITGSVSDTSSGTVSYNTTVVASTTGSVTLNFGNRSITNLSISSTGTYTLSASNLTVAGDINISSNPTVNFGSNSISCSRLRFAGTTTTGTLNLNSSTITLSPVTAGNQTFIDGSNNSATRVINAGTSTIICVIKNLAGLCPLTAASGYTFNEIRIKDNNEVIQPSNITALQIRANTTIGTLSFDNTNTASTNPYLCVQLLGNVTINNFGVVNSTAMRRMLVFTNIGTSPFTITTNSAPTGLTDTTFFNVTVTGTAAPITGTRVVALQGTTGVTPSAGKTVYWNKPAGGSWVVNNAYATSSGGLVDENNYPLPQDTVIIENTGLNISATIEMNQADGNIATVASSRAKQNTGGIDMSSRTNAMTFSFASSSGSNSWFTHGSFRCGTGTTLATNFNLILVGSGTILSNGKTFINSGTASFIIDATGTYTLEDAFSNSTQTIILTAGGLNTAGFTVTSGSLSSSNSNSRTITLGASTLTLSGNTPIDFTTSTNLTFNANTSQINASNANSIVNGGGVTFNNLTFTSTAVGSRSISGGNTFNNLTLIASASGLSQLSIAANQIISGTFTCAGTSVTQRGFVRSDTIGTARTLTVATLSAADCDFRDIALSGASSPASPTRAGDCGGNTNIIFPSAKQVYWNLAGSQNWNANGWALTNNGSPAVNNFPLPQDTATFTNSGSAGTVFLAGSYNTGVLDASTRTSAMTLNYSASYNFYGSHTLGSGLTVSGTTAQTFSGASTIIFTSAGKTIPFPIVIDTSSGTFQLGDAVTTSNTITHTRGIFSGVTYNLTCTTFSSNNSNSRTINMGSGTWTLSGTGTIWDFTTTTGLTFNKDTANILLSNTTTTARTFAGGNQTYNVLTIGGATGISALTFTGSNTFSGLASTKTVAHTLSFTAGTTTTVAAWTITGTSGNVVTIQSATAASHTLSKTGGGVVSCNFMSISRSTATPATTWYAGANSTNGGNNSGWTFTAPPAPAADTGNMFFLID